MSDNQNIIEKLQNRVGYLEEVNQKIQFSLEAVRSLIMFQGEMKIEDSLETICKQGIERIIDLINVKVGAIFLFSDDLIDITLEYAHPVELHNEIQKEVDLQIDKGAFSWAIQQNAPIIAAPLHLTSEQDVLLHSLVTKNKILGMFFCQLSGKKNKMYQEDLDILSIALTIISLGMENAILYQKVKFNNAMLEKVVEERTRELEVAKNSAEAASKAKSEFMAIMSHEIRTPMNSIIGFADMLYETPVNAEQKDFINSIKTSGGSLLDLINEILDFSKIEAGKMDIEVIEFDLKDTVQEVYTITSSKIIDKGLQFEIIKDLKVNCNILGSSTRLRQILINLVGNAVKFTEAGKITLTFKVEDETDSLFKIYFSVEDDGIGIPQDKLDQVFLAFTQADSSTTRRYGGTGLGLTISSQLVQLMGGDRIRVESIFGKGSRFFFTIPFKKGLKPVIKDKEETSQINSENKSVLKILLVEDTPQNIKLVTKLLEKRGHIVSVAENGKLAIDAINNDLFDAVLMDMQMPVMDGLEATREIRRQGYNIPIIAMTANAIKGDKERCLDAGMDDYVSKPIRINEVEPLIFRTIKNCQNKRK